MNVYISASNVYKAHGLETILKKRFRAKINFVSEWHKNPSDPEARLTDDEKIVRAVTNLSDLDSAKVVIVMDDYDNVPGGKHFEAGHALHAGKRLVVLGRREHGYYRHPDVLNATSLQELFGVLKGLIQAE